MIAGSALRFTPQPAIKSRDHESRNRADEERRTPAPKRSQLPARKIAQGRPDRDRKIENRKNAIAVALWIKIGQHSRSKDAESSLAHAHNRVTNIEGAIVMYPRGRKSRQAPENRPKYDERLPGKSVAEPAGKRRHQHIDDKECRRQRAHLLVRRAKFPLDQCDLAGQDVPVDVIEQIQRDQQHQRHKCGAEAWAKIG